MHALHAAIADRANLSPCAKAKLIDESKTHRCTCAGAAIFLARSPLISFAAPQRNLMGLRVSVASKFGLLLALLLRLEQQSGVCAPSALCRPAQQLQRRFDASPNLRLLLIVLLLEIAGLLRRYRYCAAPVRFQ